MEQPDPAELEALIADRSGFLCALTAAPRSKRELTELLDCSRSTIDRVLRSLADAYLVEYRDGKWHATAVGICAYRAQDEYQSFLSDLAEAAPILTELPPENLIDEAFLADSTAYPADATVPDAVLEPMLRSVRKATTVRGLVPKALAGSAEAFYDAATADSACELELVLDGDVFDRLSEIHPQETKDALNEPNVSLFRGQLPHEFGLWIADDTTAGVVVYTPQGIQGCIMNDTEAAVQWAMKQYESGKQNAEEILFRGGFQRL